MRKEQRISLKGSLGRSEFILKQTKKKREISSFDENLILTTILYITVNKE